MGRSEVDVDMANAAAVPNLARPALLRDRLLARTTQRWEYPLTVLTAGAGFGKTTLLVQAVSENALDPRGVDCWVSCRSDFRLATAIGAAVVGALGEQSSHSGALSESVERVVDLLATRSPSHVSLIFDDVHFVEAGSPGADFLTQLVDALPPNAHVVLAGRTEPPLPLARRRAQGLVNDLRERDLAFTDDETAAFAAMRLTTPVTLTSSGGWPALAELLGSASRSVADDFLWDEVLAAVTPERREALAMIHALGGADRALLSAALSRDVDPTEVTRSVPLATVTDAGWATVHDLWTDALERVLPPARRNVGLLSAARVAEARGDQAAAVRMYARAGAFDDVCAVARRVCSDSHPLVPPEELAAWHAALVRAGRGDSAEAALLAGTSRKPADPLGSMPYFALAEARFAERSDVDGEMAAIFHQGHIAWWHEDYDALLRLLDRCLVLAEQGSALAASIATLGPLVLAEVMGDGEGVLSAARTSSREHQHPEVVPIMDYLEARAHLVLGDPLAGQAPADRACHGSTPTMRPPAEFERLSCLWSQGKQEAVLSEAAAAVEELEVVAWLHNRAANGAQAALWYCAGGEPDRAKALLARAQLVRESTGNWARALLSLAEAMLLVDAGNEAEAAAVLETELAERPLADPAVARAHRAWVTLSYVLVQASRSHWDAFDLRGTVALGREVGRAIVALRAGLQATVPAASAAVLRSLVPQPWLAELAVVLQAGGQPHQARALIEDLPHPQLRAALHGLAKIKRKPAAAAASSLLASVALPPARRLSIGLLGSLEVRYDGELARPAALNRRAVRDVLCLLVDQRNISRARICALLWPDLADEAARNNLRVALSALLQVLQPERPPGEHSYYVEDVGDDLRLRPGAVVDIDAVEFDGCIAQARDLERRGAISAARSQLERACALYRGDYLASIGDAEWTYAARERYRVRFVASAVRAGELALAGRDVDLAAHLASRAIDADAWHEPARRLLAEARLAAGDRSAALRALADCYEMLRELGVSPEPATQMLARRAGHPELIPR